MASLLEQFKAAARIAMYLVLAYLAIQLWQDPAGSAHATMSFIQGIGHFFASFFDKVGAFVKGFGK
ncbi:MAG: hypothetical protein WCI22_08015 [Actinomycetota bacterium]